MLDILIEKKIKTIQVEKDATLERIKNKEKDLKAKILILKSKITEVLGLKESEYYTYKFDSKKDSENVYSLYVGIFSKERKTHLVNFKCRQEICWNLNLKTWQYSPVDNLDKLSFLDSGRVQSVKSMIEIISETIAIDLVDQNEIKRIFK